MGGVGSRSAAVAGMGRRRVVRGLLTAVLALAIVVPSTADAVSERGVADSQPGEKKYGPFEVGPGAWVDTGIVLKKGQPYRVVATGYFKYKDPPFTEFGPGGNVLGRFVLKARIGKQFVNVGGGGGGNAESGAKLRLGAPSWEKMGEGEEPGLDRAYRFSVTVFVGPAPTPCHNIFPCVLTQDQLADAGELVEVHIRWGHLLAPAAAFPQPIVVREGGQTLSCAGPLDARVNGAVGGRFGRLIQGGGNETLVPFPGALGAGPGRFCPDPGISFRILSGQLTILEPRRRLSATLQVRIDSSGGADGGHPVGECANGLLGRVVIDYDDKPPRFYIVNLGPWSRVCRSHTHGYLDKHTGPEDNLEITGWIACHWRADNDRPGPAGISPEFCN